LACESSGHVFEDQEPTNSERNQDVPKFAKEYRAQRIHRDRFSGRLETPSYAEIAAFRRSVAADEMAKNYLVSTFRVDGNSVINHVNTSQSLSVNIISPEWKEESFTSGDLCASPHIVDSNQPKRMRQHTTPETPSTVEFLDLSNCSNLVSAPSCSKDVLLKSPLNQSLEMMAASIVNHPKSEETGLGSAINACAISDSENSMTRSEDNEHILQQLPSDKSITSASYANTSKKGTDPAKTDERETDSVRPELCEDAISELVKPQTPRSSLREGAQTLQLLPQAVKKPSVFSFFPGIVESSSGIKLKDSDLTVEAITVGSATHQDMVVPEPVACNDLQASEPDKAEGLFAARDEPPKRKCCLSVLLRCLPIRRQRTAVIQVLCSPEIPPAAESVQTEVPTKTASGGSLEASVGFFSKESCDKKFQVRRRDVGTVWQPPEPVKISDVQQVTDQLDCAGCQRTKRGPSPPSLAPVRPRPCP
jgi:hypothetical protein